MTPTDVEKMFLNRLCIRLGPEMSRYVLTRFQAGGAAPAPVPVMGGDARTGVPVRTDVDLFAALAPPPPDSVPH